MSGISLPKILIAEDDPTVRGLLGKVLKLAHYDSDFAEDGMEAVEMWERE